MPPDPDDPARPLSVYRLLPSMREFQLLHFDNSPVELMRWQLGGSTGEPPTGFNAEWGGDPRWPKSEFPNGDPCCPVLSGHIADVLSGEFATAGRFAPVNIDGSARDEYLLHVVERVVDCFDERRSSPPDQIGRPKKSVFRPEALPVELPAFRFPQFPTAVCWNGWMVERLIGLLGDQLEARLIWSEDPSLTPHPDPWGF
ncbi:hypothetical protein KUF83_17610 [Streptomyces sp. BV286]|nr:hypothetical protein [Streptomyces sp. BV286]